MCCLPEADTSQQLLERPAYGKIINYRVRHDARDRTRATFFTATTALAAAAVCSRFFIVRAVRRPLTLSNELYVGIPLPTTSAACCCGHGAACREHMWSRPPGRPLPASSMAARECACMCAYALCWPAQTLCASPVCPLWTGRCAVKKTAVKT